MLSPLSRLSVGQTAVISKIRIKDANAANRLKQLNLRLGVELKLIQAEKGYPLLVGINDSRIAINTELAQQIYVNI